MRSLLRSVLVATLATAAIVACKSDGKDAAAASKPATAAPAAAVASGGACDRRAREHVCGEYFGKFATAERVKAECAAMEAPMVATCPTEGAVGSCTRELGTPQQTRTVFYAPMTADTVKAMCADGQVALP